MNRARQRSTVEVSMPRSAAACLFVPPSAQRSTIFARNARNWAVVRPPRPLGQLAPLGLVQDQVGLRLTDPVGVLELGHPICGEGPTRLAHCLGLDADDPRDTHV